MPKYHIVIADEAKAHEAHIQSYARGFAVQGHSAIRSRILGERQVGKTPRPLGTRHDTAEDDCPEGMPNCRNCGDPKFKDSCKAAGHCPNCGTKHGIAPDSVLKASGYVLEELSA